MADVLNVLSVIGADATAARLPIVEAGTSVSRIFLYLHLHAMILILTLLRIFIFTAAARGRFRRWYLGRLPPPDPRRPPTGCFSRRLLAPRSCTEPGGSLPHAEPGGLLLCTRHLEMGLRFC